jgi:hypothetical protein
MSELERQLQALAAELEWPATPELRLPALPDRGRRQLWRPLVVGVAVLLVAAGLAALVPGARSAILHWFRIGGAAVERVQTLPAVERRSLVARLGAPVGRAEAQRALGGQVRLPHEQLYLSGGVVSALLETDKGPVLLSALRSDVAVPMLLKKLAGSGTKFEFLEVVPGASGAWITGTPHVVIFPAAPPRLAGDVLLWDRNGITYRLEGPRLDKERALEFARGLAR